MTDVSFYYGLGSRYSYLASTQIDRIVKETGATIDWLPLFSGDLMAAAGNTYLKADDKTGQYAEEYRTRDIERWAAIYDIPFADAPHAGIDWSRLVRACLAAKQLGGVARFTKALYAEIYGGGAMPKGDADLIALAGKTGLDDTEFAQLLDARRTFDQQTQILQSALSAGAFGVPTFVVRGELFWGQDRIPLLVHYLKRNSSP